MRSIWGFIVLSQIWAGAVCPHPQPTGQETEETTSLDTLEVEGRATDLTGIAGSASQGLVGQPEFKYRPLARVGELVEVVPGALATQHSGSGKANQYFLRGFNLDHGTDFSVTVDGVPMNMPTHAHGQGYLDLNSIIPELVDKVEYGKGPYYADAGDFSSAGYARMHTMHKLPQGLLKFTGGEFGYYRTVFANSNQVGPGELLYAGETHFYDGVWKEPEDLHKYNGMLRYTLDEHDWGMSINGKAYHSTWTATNQIPDRAIRDGSLGLYGTMDPTDGGDSNRYSLATNFWNRGDSYKTDASVYAVYSDLELYSNFSGYIDPRGDQILQKERRVIVGGNAEFTHYDRWFGLDVDNTLGLQVRHDEILGLALNHTQARDTLDNIRRDDVGETSVGVFIKHQTHWLEKFRTIAGLRGDFFDFNVDAISDDRNSGHADAAMLSPKLSLVFGPWLDTEYFLNLGYGHHSNDARGTVQRIDPNSGDAVAAVNPLVWSRGGEIGLRSQYLRGLNTTLALWWLQMNSELVFVGDAGTTEPTGRSERYGVEWTNYYQPTDWLTLDADLAFTSASYTHVPRRANNIPNSVGRVITAGALINLPQGFFFTARLRHFGQVALTEDNTAWAGDTTLVNFGGGYQYRDYKVEVDLFNAFDSKSSDIAYYYNSCLRGEACPGGDDPGNPGLMRHPVEPRMVRVAASLRF
ncbi:TonB-dependent receptor [Methylocaldum sp.]|uniref:TonB-dependent receptor n=1 Tax=Methylocaldum sp. TaxID=1969727 RepID=UPI002D4C99A3|nr:TonB-dependent receptor [Methylocaldum sp.]HYE37534.1 TonB-dependent receptor [Methylocaldum sp.]